MSLAPSAVQLVIEQRLLRCRVRALVRRLRERTHELRAACDERGSVLALAVIMLPVQIAFLALMVDGAMLYAARRELQDAADAAALSGAMQVDLEHFAQTGEWRIAETATLPGQISADEAVQQICDRYNVDCVTHLPPADEGQTVQVLVKRKVTTFFTGVVFAGQIDFAMNAEATAALVAAY